MPSLNNKYRGSRNVFKISEPLIGALYLEPIQVT